VGISADMRLLPTVAAVGAMLAVATSPSVANHDHHTRVKLDTIALPTAFQPEGIASSGHDTFYVGSIPTGAVYRGSFRTGKGAVLVPAREGRAAIGMKLARKTLYVAGGPTGKAFLYNARTGADVADLQLAPAGQPTFVNDVVVTRRGAYFTDSRRAALYRVAGGKASELALTGITMAEGNNLNGIVAARGGRVLLAVQSNVGALHKIDAKTGAATPVDLGGKTLVNGDGMLLAGHTLFVVQNRANKIAVVKLSRDLSHGKVVAELTDSDFNVPTTITANRGDLWAVNAKFGTAPAGTPYEIVRVGLKGRRGSHRR
jgi:hypothetical protein